MYPSEWQSFMLMVKERKLPKGCNLHAVQAQLYQYYKSRSITTAQWAEFEAGMSPVGAKPALAAEVGNRNSGIILLLLIGFLRFRSSLFCAF